MASKACAAVVLLALACLVPTVFAASRRDAGRTPPPRDDAENAGVQDDSPTILISRVVLETEESTNEQDTDDKTKERRVATREGNEGQHVFLETLLSIPGTVKTVSQGLLNGVVGVLFRGAQPATDDDAR